MCPFSLLISLSQIKKRVDSFSNNSSSYIKKFKYLTQLFSTLILFPNPSLIFEKNLNRQRVALKPPREIL
jgi:hypothetical protein